MPRLGPRSQVAGTGRPLQVVRNEVVRTGCRDYFIEPVLPPPEQPGCAAELRDRVLLALKDEGWEMHPDERVELQLFYEDPVDGCWLTLNDRVYREIFVDEMAPEHVPRPKLLLRPAKCARPSP